MSQSPCSLHFDDPTAHATVEWFLSQLSSANEESGQALLDILTKEGSILPEDLYKSLTAARFTDCLREEIGKKGLFETIESIAKALEKETRWQDFPNLTVLLFSIARNPLKCSKFVKETKLYSVGRALYDHFKQKVESASESTSESDVSAWCRIALEAGFQLSHFEDEQWKYEFARFKGANNSELLKLRAHYYSTNDHAELFKRVVETWKRHTEDSIVKTFDKSCQSFGKLDPMLMELPIPSSGGHALQIVENWSQIWRQGTSKQVMSDLNRHLARTFRILQWDVYTRNRAEEERTGLLSFHLVTTENEIEGKERWEFLTDLILRSRLVQRDFFPLEGQLPKPRECNNPKGDDAPSSDMSDIKKYQNDFDVLAPQIPRLYPSVHADLIQSSTNIRRLGEYSNSVLIEDGEILFFSLLWVLRHAVSQNGKISSSLKGSTELSVRFRPTDDYNTELWWSTGSPYNRTDELGLTIPLSASKLPESKCIPTRRWLSLVRWLRQSSATLRCNSEGFDGLRGDKWLSCDDKSLKWLPVKRLAYDGQAKAFLRVLWECLASDELEKQLYNLDEPDTSAPMPYNDFTGKKLAPLLEILEPLISLQSSVDVYDRILFRCCRVGFLPLEYLLRAYQPYELHLLILPLNWEKSTIKNLEHAPISLAFATIAGTVPQVPREQNSTDISASFGELELADFDRWLVPYWTLLSALASELSLSEMHAESKKLGSADMLGAYSHEVGKLGSAMLHYWLLSAADVFGLDSGTPSSYAWKPPAFDIKVPDEHRQFFSRWKICPVPEPFDALSFLFLIWGGSENLAKQFNPENGSDISLKQLVIKLANIARTVASARLMFVAGSPENIHQAIRFEKRYNESLNNIAKFNEPKGDGSNLKVLMESGPFRIISSYFIRALMAALSNAAFHAEFNTEIEISLEHSNNFLDVIIVNKPKSVRQDNKVDSEFSMTTHGVIIHCMSNIDGNLLNFPKPGDNPAETSFRVPKITGDGGKVTWLIQP